MSKQLKLFDIWRPTTKPIITSESVIKCEPIITSESVIKCEPIKARDTLCKFFIRFPSEYTNPEYKSRLEEEYELIDKNGFTRVFIQVRIILDIIDEMSKESGKTIPHIIRGSAGCSLICYFMGITNIDPIYYKIELARFMNTGRTDIPDIDIDVPYNRREELYLRISRKWPGLVARISNHVKWGNITALRQSVIEVLRAKDDDTAELQQKARKKGFNINRILPNTNDKQHAIAHARKLEGTLRHYSKHCGGIVIFEETGEVPEDLILYPQEHDKPLQIRLNKDETEDAGYIKIDILSNRGLAQFADITTELDLTKYPEKSYVIEQIFARGNTIGLTFGESRGMRRIFMEIQPKCIEDVATALALIRPGASMDGRKADYYKRRRAGKLDTDNLAEFSIIYDDDAIALIRRLLGCTSAEADSYRKAFAKGDQRKQDEMYVRGYRRGHSEDTLDAVTDNLSNLRYYSFCKSHAMSYAQLVWALAYWKAVAPHRFWCATLNHCHSDFRRWVHYREAFCSGLQLSYGRSPYKLEGNRLVSLAGEPSIIQVPESVSQQIIREYRTYGYWTTKEFMPTCRLTEIPYDGSDTRSRYRFRGVIATGRIVSRTSMTATMITLGYDNGCYMDLMISGMKRGDLLYYSVLEGEAYKKSHGTYEAITVKGVAIGALLAKSDC